VALFGVLWHCLSSQYRKTLYKPVIYFVERNFINRFMQKDSDQSRTNAGGTKPLFPPRFNPARQGGFLCSPEHGKLCFEQLQKISAAQNHLPLQGAENASEVSFF
jgi:hypothetical protein